MPALGRRLGVTDRHLRRIFQAQHGVSPLDYLTTQRLLLAKQLLTDTTQAVTQVALASGFASVRRFNAAFAERYRFSPTRLRREGAAQQGLEPTRATLRLAYRPPYDVAALLAFFAQRAVRRRRACRGADACAAPWRCRIAACCWRAGSRAASCPSATRCGSTSRRASRRCSAP